MVPEEETGEKFSIVGTRQARYDANLKVSGSAVFGTDIRLPKMLYGKIFRSTVAHAKIVKLDLSKAESYPGVRAAVTANDFPDLTYGFAVRSAMPGIVRGRADPLAPPHHEGQLARALAKM